MLAFAIYLEGNKVSENALERLKTSFYDHVEEVELFQYKAITSFEARKLLESGKMRKYTYPLEGASQELVIDNKDYYSLVGHGYKTKDIFKRIACAYSHMHIWQIAARLTEPVMILEHDALFTRSLCGHDFEEQMQPGWVVGINNPQNATRKAAQYHALTVQLSEASGDEIVQVPVIDNPKVPQGLAGNSAYVITPEAAQFALEESERLGTWPNDALLCHQIMGKQNVRQAYPYYTRVQGTESTTSL